MATSIKDVARAAGVSTATVSYVLNKRVDKTISLKVRRRVTAAAKKLNYRPHGPAQALASRKTRNIALILHGGTANLSNTFYSEVLEGMAREIMQVNYHLMFGVIKPGYRGEEDMPDIIGTRSVDGVVTMGTQPQRFIKDLYARQMPVAMVDPSYRGVEVPMILVDNRRGADLAVKHLLSLRHRHFAILSGRRKHQGIIERNECYRQALAAGGIKDFVELKQELHYNGGLKGGEKIVDEHPHVTAVLTSNDEMALGAVQAILKKGKRVPEDISVVGFDGISETRTTSPQLTTVYVDKRGLGSMAVRCLLEVIDVRDNSPKVSTAGVNLVVRETTGPARSV